MWAVGGACAIGAAWGLWTKYCIQIRLPIGPPASAPLNRSKGSADAYLRFIPRTEMDIAVVGAAGDVPVTVKTAVRCEDCGGSGRAVERKQLDVEIPPGIHDGQRIRLSGAGSGPATSCSCASGSCCPRERNVEGTAPMRPRR